MPEQVPHLLGSLVMLERRPEGFRYRLVGSKIASMHGRDLTGRGLADWPAVTAATIREQYDLVIDRRLPIVSHYHAPAYRDGRFEVVEWKWEKIVLPLAFGPDGPDGVLLCAAEWEAEAAFPTCWKGPKPTGCWCVEPGRPAHRP